MEPRYVRRDTPPFGTLLARIVGLWILLAIPLVAVGRWAADGDTHTATAATLGGIFAGLCAALYLLDR